MSAVKAKSVATYLIAGNALFTRATALIFICLPVRMQAEEAPAIHVSAAVQAFSSAAEGVPPAPWRVVGLPGNTRKPLTQFDIVQLAGEKVLRVHADHSYANLTHDLMTDKHKGHHMLSWRWRLDKPVVDADLHHKSGDDTPIKVCALFDLPLDHLSFVERNLLRLARSATGEHLPGATLCYVWDQKLPTGSELPSAFTKRIRYQVLDSSNGPLQHWVSHSRDLNADFLHSFGSESGTVPPLLAIVVGADADNTGGSSLAYVGDVSLVEQ